MKVLVTGATGFVGQHIVRRLVADGHAVVASGTDPTKAQTFDWYAHVRFVPYTIGRTDADENLYAFFDRPDALIHAAWPDVGQPKSLLHVEQYLPGHLSFLKSLILGGLTNATILGTCYEYGMQEGCLHEDQPANPVTAYGLAKDTLRRYLQLLQQERPFALKWLRLFYLYGEGQNPKSIIPQLQEAIRSGASAFNMSGGEQLRDYSSVTDVAAHICTIAGQNRVQGVINCCSGQPISVRHLVEDYVRTTQSPIKLNLGYYPYVAHEPMAFWGDTTKLRQATSA